MMGLKQIRISQRIEFLKLFTEEIINNSKEEERKKHIIESEKLKQKIHGKESPDEALKKMIRSPIFSKSPQKKSTQTPPTKNQITKRKPSFHRIKIPKRHFIRKHPQPQQSPQQISQKTSNQTPSQPSKQSQKQPSKQEVVNQIKPEPQPTPQGLSLGKLQPLLKDKSIQLIECPSPGKNVLVKRYNKINTTPIQLSNNEIKSIITDFSKKAKIPVVGGILKAAVGDMVISAVTSEYIGSRFIITKITPFSQLQNQQSNTTSQPHTSQQTHTSQRPNTNQ